VRQLAVCGVAERCSDEGGRSLAVAAMKTLALLLIFLPSLALARANSGSQGPATKILVWYDPHTLAVIETVVPDNDAEGRTAFSSQAHPVGASQGAATRVEVAVTRINAVGFAKALNEAAPGMMLTASQQQSLSLLGEQVTATLAQEKVRAALAHH
jgi:hypothetical protein